MKINLNGSMCFGVFICMALLSACNNEQPEQKQFVAVATPTNTPKPLPTAKPTPVPKPKYFSKLRLLKPIYNGSNVKIQGSTDLPDGAEISVTFNVAGRADTDTYIGVDEKVKVQNGKFISELEIPDRPEFGSGRYEVEAMFTPRSQSSDVLAQVGTNGEKLTGDKSKKTYNFRTLEASRPSRRRVKVSTYAMVKPSNYESGTAERAFANFLQDWKNEGWSQMASHSQLTWVQSQSDAADMLSAWFSIKKLLGAKITNVESVSDVTKDITASVRYAVGSEIHNKTLTARVICETAPYTPSIDGEWGVNPTSALREN